LQLRPHSDDPYRRLGRAYLEGGRKDEAIGAYRKAVDANPFHWRNHYQLGEAYRKYGNMEDALKEFGIVIDQVPTLSYGYGGIGNANFEQGNYEDCIRAYEKALAVEPSRQSYEINSSLGTAYFFMKRYKEAAAKHELAVTMNPNDDLTHGNLADDYRLSQQLAKADAEYGTAIRLALKRLAMNPRDSPTLGNLALYYAKREKYDQALDAIRRARRIDRNDPDLIYDQAVVETLSGQSQQALKTLRDLLHKNYSLKNVENDPDLNQLQRQLPVDFAKLTTEFGGKSR
jgi:tetratricopeptide (TPR) repeat protein